MAHLPGLGLLTTDRTLVVRSWNAWLAGTTGVDEARAVGTPLLDLIPADRRELYGEVLAEVLERGTSRVLAPAFHHHLFACPPAAPSAHFATMQQRVTVAPLQAAGEVAGVVAGVIVTIEDMTAALDEQRALAARLQPRERALAKDALAAVGAPDWRVRGDAVRALKESASAEDIAELLAAVERDHQSLDVLSSALRVLISANRDVVAPLIRLLADPQANLRMHAALALGELRDPDAVPALVAALDDGDPNVRFHAIEALGRLAAPAAVEALTRIAESGDFFLSFPAIDALARTDDPRVAPNLLGMLGHEQLRPAVIDTLAALGDEECVPGLVALLNERAGDAAPVAAALEQIRGRYEHAFGAGDQIVDTTREAITGEGIAWLAEAVRRRAAPVAPAIVVLGWMGRPAIDTLVTLIGDPALHASAARGLLAAGHAATAPLLALLESGDRPSRLGAVALLGRVGDRRAVPALRGILDEADAELVAAAVSALATLGDPRALDSLLPLFAHDQAAVRQAAIAAINAVGTGLVEPRVRECLADPRPAVRECAVRVAGYFGFDSCMAGILAALDDAEDSVRRAAIEQLPVTDHPQSAVRLGLAITSETPRNRAAAAHAARHLDEASLDTPLLAALADPDPWVRYFAAGSLGDRRQQTAAPALARMAVDDPAPPVRIAAIQSLGAIDPEAAVPVAARLLGGPDDDLSCGALAAVASARNADADRLFDAAVRATSPAIRRCAVDALASRRTVAAVEALAVAARLTDPPALASAAVTALGALAAAADTSADAVAALIEIGIEPGRREETVGALTRVTGDAIAPVARVWTHPRAAARLTAVEALARMRHPRASAALAEALGDDDASVRVAAVAGFGRLGTRAVAERIAALRDRDPDASVRRTAAIVCDRYGWGR
jgi:HEAT repeat protein